MRSKVADRIRAKTPDDVRIFVKLYADIVVRINQIMREKGYTQRYLAGKMEKSPSEIHKWLSGEHNFTLKSLAKLQAELGEVFLHVDSHRLMAEFTKSEVYVEKASQVKVIPISSLVSSKSSSWNSTETKPLNTVSYNVG